MKDAIRVLQVLGGTSLGGAESRIMDIYRNIDRTKVQFDFMVHNNSEDHYNAEIRSLGGHIYRVPRFRIINIGEYCRAWKQFFYLHKEYQAVHGHMTSTASIYLPIAKKSGVSITAAHARSAGTDPGLKGIMTKLLRKPLYRRTDYCLACSGAAGEAVFGRKRMEQGQVQIVPNAVELDKYAFCEETRRKIRKELNIENQFVVGHVGRFHYAKNHEFLIDIFHEIVRMKHDSLLLLVGEGDLMPDIRQRAQQLGIADKVIFTGNHANVWEYYQAMDYLVFPSRFEGLPGTVVEAQAAGLPCLIADTITPEVMATDLVKSKSLLEPPRTWAREVLQSQRSERTKSLDGLREKGFDVKTQVGQMEAFYLGKSKKVL